MTWRRARGFIKQEKVVLAEYFYLRGRLSPLTIRSFYEISVNDTDGIVRVAESVIPEIKHRMRCG